MVHQDYKEMIPARALSALDLLDDRALTEHLSGCHECRRELEDWQATCAVLALDAAPALPSLQLRERVLREVHEESRTVTFDEKRTARGYQVLPFRGVPGNVWSSIGSLGAIAASVLFVALLGSVVVLWRENRAAETKLAILTAQLKTAQQDLDRVNEVKSFLTAPGSRMAELVGTAVAPDAMAKLAYDKTGHAMLMAQGLPPAPAGKEYQLWFIVGDKPPMPGNAFAPDSLGNGISKDQVPAVAMNSAVFAITLEPTGGVRSPTGAIYLRSS
jgi:anti-sigma-K factor RskA